MQYDYDEMFARNKVLIYLIHWLNVAIPLSRKKEFDIVEKLLDQLKLSLLMCFDQLFHLQLGDYQRLLMNTLAQVGEKLEETRWNVEI
jgi:hypothetical protein